MDTEELKKYVVFLENHLENLSKRLGESIDILEEISELVYDTDLDAEINPKIEEAIRKIIDAQDYFSNWG